RLLDDLPAGGAEIPAFESVFLLGKSPKFGFSMSQALSASPVKPPGGLEGVVAAKSDICFINGTEGQLIYRGYDIADVVENLSFEEVAYLLWEGKLPNRTELANLKQQL